MPTAPKLTLRSNSGVLHGGSPATNGQTVNTFQDQSASSFVFDDAWGQPPTFFTAGGINGLPRINFNGAHLLTCTGMNFQPKTWFRLAQSNNPSTYATWLGGGTSDTGGKAAYYIQEGNIAVGSPWCGFLVGCTNGTVNNALTQQVVNTYCIIAGRYNTTSGRIEIYRNGVLVGSDPIAGTPNPADVLGASLGSGFGAGPGATPLHDFTTMDFIACDVYDVELSDADFDAKMADYSSLSGIAVYARGYALDSPLLGACFSGLETTGAALRIMGSADDGTSMHEVYTANYYPPSPGFLRDVDMWDLTAIDGYYYICYTNLAFASNSTFAIARSPNKMDWAWVSNVDCSSVSGSGADARVYAPSRFVDLATGNEHFRVSISSNNIDFKIYDVGPTSNYNYTSWGSFTLIEQPVTRTVDPYVITLGGNYYEFWDADTASAGYSSSSSVNSGYSTVSSSLFNGVQGEGPTSVLLASTVRRFWVDSFVGGDVGLAYADSGVGDDWTNLNTATVAFCATPYYLRQGNFLQPASPPPPTGRVSRTCSLDGLGGVGQQSFNPSLAGV